MCKTEVNYVLENLFPVVVMTTPCRRFKATLSLGDIPGADPGWEDCWQVNIDGYEDSYQFLFEGQAESFAVSVLTKLRAAAGWKDENEN